MRKHPVTLGIMLLMILGGVSALFFYGTGIFSDGSRSFKLHQNIGVIPIEGVISDSGDIVDQIEEFADDQDIRAVVLRIDSPGGAVAPAQEIYQAVLELKKKKKVIVSMGSVAASGGYLIAVASDRILANPGTITGSISAVMHHANIEELMKKIGVASSVVKSGKFKDIGSPTRKMTDEEKAIIQGIIDDIYNQFVEVIVQNRKMPVQDVLQLADGRIFSGRQAKKLGLIDDLGGFSDAVALAGRLAGIRGKPEVVYGIKRKDSIFRHLTGKMTSLLFESLNEKRGHFTGVLYLLQ
jgi:protease IV